MKKKLKITIAVIFVLLIGTIGIKTAIYQYKITNGLIPVMSDDAEIQAITIKYDGKTYHCLTMYANNFEFDIDKKIYQDGRFFPTYYYTVKNDTEHNFIIVSQYNESLIFTSLDTVDYDSFTDVSGMKKRQFSEDISKQQ